MNNIKLRHGKEFLLHELKQKLKYSEHYQLGWRGYWSEVEMIYWLSELELAYDHKYIFYIDNNKLKAKHSSKIAG